MARPLRIEYPGAVYHVTSRGDARRKIFMDNTDRQQFLTVEFPEFSIYPNSKDS
jgi:REP element-mobilizing transposase RayT